MDNNYPPPQYNPNATEPLTASPAAQTPDLPPEKPVNKFIIIAVAGAGFIIILTIVVAIIAATAKKPAATKQNGGSQTTKSPDELEQAIAKDIYIDKVKYDLTITTPHGWGTQQNNNVITGIYPWEDAKFLTSFRFRDAQFSVNTRATSANNYIAVQDVSSWLTTSRNNYPLTAFAKRNNFDLLSSLWNVDAVTPELMAKIINPRSNSEIGGRIKPQIIKSPNSSVNGVAYLTVIGSSPTYAPRMILLMSGHVNNRQIYIYGDITFTDNLKVGLDKQKAESDPKYSSDNAQAFNDLKAGKLTAELQKFYEQSLAAFKSIKIERSRTDDILEQK